MRPKAKTFVFTIHIHFVLTYANKFNNKKCYTASKALSSFPQNKRKSEEAPKVEAGVYIYLWFVCILHIEKEIWLEGISL